MTDERAGDAFVHRLSSRRWLVLASMATRAPGCKPKLAADHDLFAVAETLGDDRNVGDRRLRG